MLELATYPAATATTAAAATSNASASTSWSTLVTSGSFAVGLSWTGSRLASDLNADLAVEDFLTGQVGDRLVSFLFLGDVDKSVSNSSGGAWVDGDRDRLAIESPY